MREKVCIVLNEREPLKAQAAASLASALERNGITSSRIPVTENIVTTLKRRAPEICVLDYLLGDYTTGLDILSELQTLPLDRRPEVFMFTDEPSAKVAAESIKLGALDYFEIDNPAAVPTLTNSIIENFARIAPTFQAPRRTLPTIDDLPRASPTSQKLIERLTTLASDLPPVVVFIGAPGSGRTTAAHALASATARSPRTTLCDLRTFTASVATLFPDTTRAEGNLSCLIVQNLEYDDGELWEFVTTHKERWWGRSTNRPATHAIFLCATDRSEAQKWLTIHEAEECVVHSLSAGKEDVAPLIHSIVREIETATGKKVRTLSSEVLLWLQGLPWPGNIRELRSVLTDTVLSCPSTDESFKEVCTSRKDFWEEWHAHPAPPHLSPLEVARVLEETGHNARRAAVRLGISPRTLRTILEGEQ